MHIFPANNLRCTNVSPPSDSNVGGRLGGGWFCKLLRRRFPNVVPTLHHRQIPTLGEGWVEDDYANFYVVIFSTLNQRRILTKSQPKYNLLPTSPQPSPNLPATFFKPNNYLTTSLQPKCNLLQTQIQPFLNQVTTMQTTSNLLPTSPQPSPNLHETKIQPFSNLPTTK